MKFICNVEINVPIDRVIELFDNPDNLKEWQDGFISFEHLSGTPGEPGAKSLLKYKHGKREMELIETITVKNLPEEFSGTYEHKHMENSIKCSFISLSSNKTRLDYHIDYFKFKSFMPRLMAFLSPGIYKKYTQKWLDQFKAFAEKSA
ncbi:SRPBCC family protein [Aquimarina sp. 2201CG5-10]|uniref:SRPBCC family protein n=1 Tax=Aquimarina callyspongiae TaxID=3098150 RepID=UPI002AB5161B|nr:SRPBCC family protein [Aquimarina sp. 2201CG5-10]MDY8135632.1 SRPBCC family protein [Aquimarina sp. 2201CG5-10]